MTIFNEQGTLTGNWHQCPNILTDKLIGQVISPNAGWIVLNVWRLTLGMHGRLEAAIPTERFMNLLNINKKRTAYKFIKEAVNSGLITVKKVRGMINVYSINKNCSLWSGLQVVPKIEATRVVPKMGTLIKTDFKDKKESSSSSRENDFSILIKECQEWQQPALDKINEQLKTCKTVIAPLTSDDYQFQVTKFKNWLAEQAANDRPVKTNNRRIDLLIDWIERDYLTQQKKAKTTATNKTDWRSVGVKPNDADSDLPSVFNSSPSHSNPVSNDYHPSHIGDNESRNNESFVLNGKPCKPFPDMTTTESENLVDSNLLSGEQRITAYNRLLDGMTA